MSTAGADAGVSVINYYRGMEGLAPVSINADWSKQAQAAALILAANLAPSNPHDLSDTSLKCYSVDGKNGAASSNLFPWGGASTVGLAETGYINDSGNPTTLGHRRWLLYPGLTQVGFGQVKDVNATKVFDTLKPVPAGSPAYVPWPAAGYVPMALVPSDNTWSFSVSDAGVDLLGAQVSMTSDGATIPVTVSHPAPNFGSPTLAFNPGKVYSGGPDKAFTITVTGLTKNGVALPAYTYTVTLFDQSKAENPGTPSPSSTSTSSVPSSTSTSTVPSSTTQTPTSTSSTRAGTSAAPAPTSNAATTGTPVPTVVPTATVTGQTGPKVQTDHEGPGQSQFLRSAALITAFGSLAGAAALSARKPRGRHAKR